MQLILSVIYVNFIAAGVLFLSVIAIFGNHQVGFVSLGRLAPERRFGGRKQALKNRSCFRAEFNG